MSSPVVLFWDIDGTLLTTARAGVYALEKAALEMTGVPLDLQGLPTAGLTDVEIARLILETKGVDASEENTSRFLRIYEDDLPASLHRRTGRVMPNVREVLSAVRELRGWHSMLLTGNTARGAAAKLAHYGIAEFFEGGAFSDGTKTRSDVARRALAMAQARQAELAEWMCVVVGDTAHDIACAKAIGARCLAVATGGFSVDSLLASGADVAVSELPAPGRFVEICRMLAGQAVREDQGSR